MKIGCVASRLGCFGCHGPGGDYQPVKDSYKNDDFPREEVIETGLLYAQLETCTVCHNTDEDNPYPEPHFETEAYDDGLLESHDHVEQEKHPPREGSEWLYEEEPATAGGGWRIVRSNVPCSGLLPAGALDR